MFLMLHNRIKPRIFLSYAPDNTVILSERSESKDLTGKAGFYRRWDVSRDSEP